MESIGRKSTGATGDANGAPKARDASRQPPPRASRQPVSLREDGSRGARRNRPLTAAVATYGEALAAFHPETIGPLSGVRNFAKSVGGAEVNVAIGLARLGHRVRWLGATGADAIGHEVLLTLRREDVDISQALVDPAGWTGLYLKELGALGQLDVHYFRSGSAASRVKPGDLHPDALRDIRVLHLSGITAAISDQSREILGFLFDLAAEHKILISFDANVRRALIGDRDARALIHPFIRRCDFLFLSAEESHIFFGTSDPTALASSFNEINAQDVVVHDESGAFCLTAAGVAEVQARQLAAVDVVGAGDAVVAGYLSGWLRGWNPADRLRLAECCAAAVVSVPGDHAGSPTETQALASLRNPKRENR